MSDLTLSQASQIIDRALQAARAQSMQPLAIIVLDAGGHTLAFKREDGASFLRHDIAHAKAYGALGMGYGTRDLARRAASHQTFYTALFAVSQGQMAPSPGGVLIRSGNGKVIGAVGVSGDTGDNDEVSAVAGIKGCGLTPDTGA